MAALLRGAHARLHLVRVGPASALAGSAAAGRAVAGASGGGGGLRNLATAATAASYLSKEEVLKDKFNDSNYLTSEQFYYLPNRPRTAAYFTSNAKFYDVQWELKNKITDAKIELLRRKHTGEYLPPALLDIPDATEVTESPEAAEGVAVMTETYEDEQALESEFLEYLKYVDGEIAHMDKTFETSSKFLSKLLTDYPGLKADSNTMAAFEAINVQVVSINEDTPPSVRESLIAEWNAKYTAFLTTVASKMPGRDSIETKCQLLKQALEPEIVDPSDNDKKNRHTPTIRNELLAHIKEIQDKEIPETMKIRRTWELVHSAVTSIVDEVNVADVTDVLISEQNSFNEAARLLYSALGGREGQIVNLTGKSPVRHIVRLDKDASKNKDAASADIGLQSELLQGYKSSLERLLDAFVGVQEDVEGDRTHVLQQHVFKMATEDADSMNESLSYLTSAVKKASSNPAFSYELTSLFAHYTELHNLIVELQDFKKPMRALDRLRAYIHTQELLRAQHIKLMDALFEAELAPEQPMDLANATPIELFEADFERARNAAHFTMFEANNHNDRKTVFTAFKDLESVYVDFKAILEASENPKANAALVVEYIDKVGGEWKAKLHALRLAIAKVPELGDDDLFKTDEERDDEVIRKELGQDADDVEDEEEELPFLDSDYVFEEDRPADDKLAGLTSAERAALLENERLERARANLPTWLAKPDFEKQIGTALKQSQYQKLCALMTELMFEPLGPELFGDGLKRFIRKDSLVQTFAKVHTIDKYGRAYATGRRKTAVARVWVSPGDGHVVVNGQVMTDYFPRLRDRAQITEPLGETGTAGTLNVFATVKGGGLTGQTQAIRHGISKALVILNPEYKPSLKAAGLMRRDPRRVERKKPGQKKARKKFTWVKR